MTHLELACAHFRTDKVIKLVGNDEKENCFINAKNYFDAIMIFQEYEATGERKNILFQYELDNINADKP